MSMVLFDLPNFYNGLIAESSIGPTLIKAYFLDWLDLGLLASAINPDRNSSIGTWVYYSDRMMGRNAARISREELVKFAQRQNLLLGTSAVDVGIRGKQGESFRFICERCGETNATQSESEKGIDSSLITHLFDTIDHWKTATIVSQDADYVPAVKALRRRGKLVFCAGFRNRASKDLIRECFEYKDIQHDFIATDLALFLLFKNDGLLNKFLKTARETDEVILKSSFREKAEMFDEGGWLDLVVLANSGVKEIPPDKENILFKQAREIQKEFPIFYLREKAGPRELIRMGLFLNPIQHGSLIRANENYLDIKVFG